MYRIISRSTDFALFQQTIQRFVNPIKDQGYQKQEPVVIEDDVWIGGRVTILPGVTVGKGSVLGACAVVTKDVEPYAVVVGNPARVIKYRNR